MVIIRARICYEQRGGRASFERRFWPSDRDGGGLAGSTSTTHIHDHRHGHRYTRGYGWGHRSEAEKRNFFAQWALEAF